MNQPSASEVPARGRRAPLRHQLRLAAVFLAVGAVVGYVLWHQWRLRAELNRLQAQVNSRPVPPAPAQPPVAPPAVEAAAPEVLTEAELQHRVALLRLDAAYRRRFSDRPACAPACANGYTLLRSGEVMRAGERLTVLLFRVDEPGACRDCSAALSLFEFRSGVVLASERIAFADLRVRGQLDRAGVSLRQLTDDDYALVLAINDPGDLFDSTRMVIHRITPTTTQQVFEQTMDLRARPSVDPATAAAAEWTSGWEFVDVLGAPPDLVVSRRLTPGGAAAAGSVRYRLSEEGYRPLPTEPAAPAASPAPEAPQPRRWPAESPPTRV